MILPQLIFWWIVSMLLAERVENSCDMVNSPKHGNLKVVKENPMNSRCFDNIILEKSANEKYCLAKDPDPNKKVTLDCKINCAGNTASSVQT